jgi:hypothetical protein
VLLALTDHPPLFARDEGKIIFFVRVNFPNEGHIKILFSHRKLIVHAAREAGPVFIRIPTNLKITSPESVSEICGILKQEPFGFFASGNYPTIKPYWDCHEALTEEEALYQKKWKNRYDFASLFSI